MSEDHPDPVPPLSPAQPSLDFALDPADLPALLRTAALARDGAAQTVKLVWPNDAIPAAVFTGSRRRYRLDSVGLEVLHGTLRGVTAERPACRVTLTGPAARLGGTVDRLGAGLGLSVPRGGLEVEAASVAQDSPMPPLRLGPPQVPPHQTVTAAFAGIVFHLMHVLLHWSDRCSAADPVEAVHQARVATRRLRSALSIFKHALPCPEIEALAPAVKDCAARLGAVRDWDVFLGGAGARLAAALPGDTRCAALLRAGRRRQQALRAELLAYFAGAEFRSLQLALACAAGLRPWEAGADPAALQQDTALFAKTVLARRAKQVRRAGRGLRDLPLPALHELRKDCKRLRYAAEFFAPLFRHRHAPRYLRRLAGLQEELGLLNDTASAGPLMAQLGRAGRGHAGGLVAGFAAAAAASARDRVGPAWKQFRAAGPFWAART